jgi:hypothetical protein
MMPAPKPFFYQDAPRFMKFAKSLQECDADSGKGA